jgi:hypothetical protein
MFVAGLKWDGEDNPVLQINSGTGAPIEYLW